MKYLQRLFALLAVTLAIFSCQKEYSVENNPNANSSSQWQFTEGNSQFKGPVDTAIIVPSGNYKVLFVNGHSTDGKDQISLIIKDSVLKAGTYKTPYSQFYYVRGAAQLYQTNQLAADSFTIVLTRIDSSGVAGTFSGKAYDTTNAYKTIVNGSFSYAFKTNTTTTPASTDSGQVLLWSKAGCGGSNTSPISVSVGGKKGQITKFRSTEPTVCDSTGGFVIKLPVGNYPVIAICGTDTLSGTVTVSKNTCTQVPVNFTTSTAVADYFPMGTGSNWTSMYEGGNPGDTTFTYSNGQILQAGGNTYTVFGYADYQYGYLDTLYYRKTSTGKYYEYFPASSNYFGFTPATAIEYEFLDTTLPANATFTGGTYLGVINGVSLTARIDGTILEKDPTQVVAGITYTNVIKVRLSFVSIIGSVTTEAYRIEQWYSRGVGLIKYQEYLSAPFTAPTSIIDLTRPDVH